MSVIHHYPPHIDAISTVGEMVSKAGISKSHRGL